MGSQMNKKNIYRERDTIIEYTSRKHRKMFSNALFPSK